MHVLVFKAPTYLPQVVSSTEVANKEVQCELDIGGKKRKRARSDYYHYTAEACAKIAKYACESENKLAVEKLSVDFGHCVSEGTVKNFNCKYLEQLLAILISLLAWQVRRVVNLSW